VLKHVAVIKTEQYNKLSISCAFVGSLYIKELLFNLSQLVSAATDTLPSKLDRQGTELIDMSISNVPG
jgi:hypothetical protein